MSENLQYFYCEKCSHLSKAPCEKEVDFQFLNSYLGNGCICNQKNLEKEECLSLDQIFFEEESDTYFKDLYTLYRSFF